MSNVCTVKFIKLKVPDVRWNVRHVYILNGIFCQTTIHHDINVHNLCVCVFVHSHVWNVWNFKVRRSREIPFAWDWVQSRKMFFFCYRNISIVLIFIFILHFSPRVCIRIFANCRECTRKLPRKDAHKCWLLFFATFANTIWV